MQENSGTMGIAGFPKDPCFPKDRFTTVVSLPDVVMLVLGGRWFDILAMDGHIALSIWYTHWDPVYAWTLSQNIDKTMRLMTLK